MRRHNEEDSGNEFENEEFGEGNEWAFRTANAKAQESEEEDEEDEFEGIAQVQGT